MTKYSITDNGKSVKLQESSQERDLGVLVTADLKPSAHCEAAGKKQDRFWEWFRDN